MGKTSFSVTPRAAGAGGESYAVFAVLNHQPVIILFPPLKQLEVGAEA